MLEAEVRKLVGEALQRERQRCVALFMCLALTFAAVSLQTPHWKKHSSSDALAAGIAHDRRMLLSQPPVAPAGPAVEESVGTAWLQDEFAALASIPTSEAPLSNSTQPADGISAPMPICRCPAAIPQVEPLFIRDDVLRWNHETGALVISANTVEITGSLVVRGYTGIKQSLFIGGDPSMGASSTEIGGGVMRMYASEAKGGPLLTAYSTGPAGVELGRLTVRGELLQDTNGEGPAREVVLKPSIRV